MTSRLVRVVTAVVLVVADEIFLNALAVIAFELPVGARRRKRRIADRVVVLIRRVAAVVHTVADKVHHNALAVLALIPPRSRTRGCCVTTEFGIFIGTISAVIHSIARVPVRNTNVVVALEPVFSTISSVGEPRRAVFLIAEISTVHVTIAPEV